MIIFVTYGDQNFNKSKKRICKEAKKFGFDKIFSFSPDDLPGYFIEKTKPYIFNKKGAGYWLWKAYILNELFSKIQTGDILVYLDAGCEINVRGRVRFKEYINFLDSNKGVLSFHIPGAPECNYTSDLVFNYFNITQTDSIFFTDQLVGGILIFRKNKFTSALIKKYYHIATTVPILFSDQNSHSTNINYIAHRHDQSVFSILRKKANLKSIPDETYSVNWNNEEVKNVPFLAKRLRDPKPTHLEKFYKKLLNFIIRKFSALNRFGLTKANLNYKKM